MIFLWNEKVLNKLLSRSFRIISFRALVNKIDIRILVRIQAKHLRHDDIWGGISYLVR